MSRISRTSGVGMLLGSFILAWSAISIAGTNAPVSTHASYDFQCETTRVRLEGSTAENANGRVSFAVTKLSIRDADVSADDLSKLNAFLARPDVVYIRPYVWCHSARPSISFSYEKASEGRRLRHSILAHFESAKLLEILDSK